MAEGLLIYFVTDGPVVGYNEGGYEVWHVEARVSNDDGETCGPMVFTFEEEQQAIDFKRKVNYTMEPYRVGGSDE